MGDNRFEIRSMEATLEAFRYRRGVFLVLDQLLLPGKHEYVEVKTVEDGWSVINRMQVRGAPAIGIAALLSLAVELTGKAFSSPQALVQWAIQKLDYLVTSRPTGVNLKIECAALKDFIKNAKYEETETLREKIIEKCEELLPRDIRDNKSMGQHGASHILNNISSEGDKKVKILTHCNTGSLATGGYGTALGVIRALHHSGRLDVAYCTETRPYNQGSRLTAYELTFDKIPAKLICDSAVSALMSTEKIDAVVVGADRIARNGDTANKIGTYQIAIACLHHHVPFYIAAPTATIDLDTASGLDIPIEERSGEEIKKQKQIQIAPPDIDTWNPAFDVTPAALITGGIITEKGVVQAPIDTPENMALLQL